jgi:hypothetical protein
MDETGQGKYEAIQWAFIEFIKSGYLWNGIFSSFWR